MEVDSTRPAAVQGNMETIATSLGSLQSLAEAVLSNNTGISGWLSQASDGGVCRLPVRAGGLIDQWELAGRVPTGWQQVK